jgi:hypothetical protein
MFRLREVSMGRRWLIGPNALPIWAGLSGAVSSVAIGAALVGVSSLEDVFLCAAIGAVPSGFVAVWMVMLMATATSARLRRAGLAIALLLGTVMGALSCYGAIIYMFSRMGE